jgi:hypothetical protein
MKYVNQFANDNKKWCFHYGEALLTLSESGFAVINKGKKVLPVNELPIENSFFKLFRYIKQLTK